MFEPTTIPEAARRIRAGDLTPLDLVERCLAQIDKYEDRLKAWVLVDSEGARAAAGQLGEEAVRGQFRGPLHGIPIGIKDIVDVAGWPTRAGSPLRGDHVAESDAPLVAALRRAGAIILGKTVTVEFACFDPSPTFNPWNPKHTPGGSSSGSAAAAAVGMCLGAIGTQTGGSLVRPSTYCGIATCKPTFGAISLDGVVPVSHHFDHAGPMARTVGDLDIMLRCMMPLGDTSGEPATPRLGLLEEFFMENASEPVREVTEAALTKLRNAGAQIEPVTFADGFEQIRPMHLCIMGVEAAAYHRESFAKHRDQYGPKITGLLDDGLATTTVDYADALSQQRRYIRRVRTLLDGVDALIMPATDTTAPPTRDTTGLPLFQAPWSAAGLPVISIPSGIGPDGMPTAIQLVGRDHQEAELLQIAAWCENTIGFDQVPPMINEG